MDTSKYIQPPKIDTAAFFYTGGSALLHIYARHPENKKATKKLYKRLKSLSQQAYTPASFSSPSSRSSFLTSTSLHAYTVYKSQGTPRRWHYRSKDDKFHRMGQMLLVAHPPYSFHSGSGRKLLGAHGFDNSLPDMQATFYAWGPAFKKHLKIKSFPNVDVYPLMAEILGLPITHAIDGKLKDLRFILQPKAEKRSAEAIKRAKTLK